MKDLQIVYRSLCRDQNFPFILQTFQSWNTECCILFSTLWYLVNLLSILPYIWSSRYLTNTLQNIGRMLAMYHFLSLFFLYTVELFVNFHFSGKMKLSLLSLKVRMISRLNDRLSQHLILLSWLNVVLWHWSLLIQVFYFFFNNFLSILSNKIYWYH